MCVRVVMNLVFLLMKKLLVVVLEMKLAMHVQQDISRTCKLVKTHVLVALFVKAVSILKLLKLTLYAYHATMTKF